MQQQTSFIASYSQKNGYSGVINTQYIYHIPIVHWQLVPNGDYERAVLYFES